jgi:hypothetical protein
MASAHLAMLNFHRQTIVNVGSTNQHFINAPLFFGTSKEDPNSTNQRSVRQNFENMMEATVNGFADARSVNTKAPYGP